MNLRAQKFVFAFALMASLAVSAANAVITFSNVSITGSLSTGATYLTGNTDIDFTLPNAMVGDIVDPIRSGSLVITYEATSDAPMMSNQIVISLLGALAGSGTIDFNEVVEDFDTLGTIASDSVTLTNNSQLPYTKTMMFDRPTTHFKAKKTFVFTAIDTREFDLAAIALVEQNIGTTVPEPGAVAAFATGLVGLLGLRRRK